MNITPWTIYWITRLDGIRETASTASFVAVLVLAVGAILIVMTCDLHGISLETAIRKTAPFSAFLSAVVVLGLLVSAFVPTTKEMCAIIVIPRIAQNESVEQIGTGVVDLAKQWIEELKPNPKEK